MEATEQVETFDPGTLALTVLLRVRGFQVTPAQIRGRCGNGPMTVRDMLRCGRALGASACARRRSWQNLRHAPLPGIAVLHGGGFLLLGEVSKDHVLVADPATKHGKYLSRSDFEKLWSGRLVLVDKRTTWHARAAGLLRSLHVRLARRAANLVLPVRLAATAALAAPASAWQCVSGRQRWEEFDAVAFDRSCTDAIPADSALLALEILLRYHGVAVDPEQIRHRLGTGVPGLTALLRFAKEVELKASAVSAGWDSLGTAPLPALAILRDGGALILGRADAEHVLVQRPGTGEIESISRSDFEAIWTGGLVLATRRAGLADLSRKFDITWFAAAVYKYRRMIAEVLTASLFLQLFALITPLFFQVVIDKVLVHRSLATLDVLIAGLVIIGLFEAILGALRTYLFVHTTNRIDVELGARLFRHLISLPIAYFQTRRVGDSVARVRELETIRQFITGSALTLVVDLLFTLVFLAVMFYYSGLLTSVAMAALPLYVAISAGLTPLFRRRLDERFRRGAENQAFLVESVTGIETLKTMAAEPQMQRCWEEQLAAYVASSFRVTNLNNAASEAVQLVSKLVSAALLYLGAKLVIAGGLSVGALVAFNMLAARINAPVLRLAQMWQDFHQARLSIERLGDILNAKPEPSISAGRAALPDLRGQVTFEHVSFRYRVDAPPTLHDICLDFQPGEVVGVVGSSGSGKSTFAKLIQRLYVPENGRVLIDGIELTTVDLAWLRRQIGVVLQENVLFNRTIRENIAFADPSAPMSRVLAAAKLAGAHDFIADLPESYDTVAGERGSALSGGQRQRIAIARALITDPRILIFDEATSALDYESERAIQQNMEQITARRTVFIIAHRLSTVRRADRIVTLERGRIVEDGTHEELIRRKGRYANLHFLQAGLHAAH